ncbi:MAG: hypothetical protein RI885_2751 [Actinomycetota bacterium]|jgi:hypothetical protein
MLPPALSRVLTVVWFAIDAVAVVAFVLVGRSSHGEGVAGVFGTAWPFLAGAVVGWIVVRGWRHPLSVRWTGIVVWVSTVAIGMLLRALSGGDVPSAFLFVSFIALGVFIVGWRAAVWTALALLGRAPGATVDTAEGDDADVQPRSR